MILDYLTSLSLYLTIVTFLAYKIKIIYNSQKYSENEII